MINLFKGSIYSYHIIFGCQPKETKRKEGRRKGREGGRQRGSEGGRRRKEIIFKAPKAHGLISKISRMRIFQTAFFPELYPKSYSYLFGSVLMIQFTNIQLTSGTQQKGILYLHIKEP